MTIGRRVSILILTVLAVVLAGTYENHAAEVGAQFPDTKRFALEGAWPASRGKVVLVDFWASWCGPCRKSFPALQSIYDRFKAQGLVVVGVSVDEDAAAMQRFLKQHTVSFPIVRDAKHQLVEAVKVSAMPTSILIDRSGTIRFVNAGFRGAETETALLRQIEQLLKGAK